MKIQHIEIYRLQIPLKINFAQANSKAVKSDSIIVKLRTKQGTLGFGESCPRSYVTGESPQEVIDALVSVQDELYRRSFESIEHIADFAVNRLPGRMKPAAICALELALLDAWSKEYQLALLPAMKGSALMNELQYSGVLPLGDFSKLIPVLEQFNFRELKLKADSSWQDNQKRIQQVRKLYSTKVKLRVDANCGWSFSSAMEQCKYLIESDVSCLEQPFAVNANSAMQKLTNYYGEWIDIMADESLTDYQSAVQLIRTKSCNRFNFKLSKNGGIFNTLKMYRLAKENGIKCQLGAHFGETSLLTAAGLLFASLAPELETIEGGLGTHLLQQDITPTPLMINQNATISREALKSYGLGVEVDPTQLLYPRTQQKANAVNRELQLLCPE